MRKLSAKKKVKKARGKDEDAAATPDSNVDLEVNENGGKNDESSDDESDNSKTVKRKSRKNAGEKKSDDTEPEDEAAEEEKKADDADEGEDEEGDEEYEAGLIQYIRFLYPCLDGVACKMDVQNSSLHNICYRLHGRLSGDLFTGSGHRG